MTIANICIIVASVLPILTVGLAKVASVTQSDRYDNHNPRAWVAKQTGWKARANAAQANGFEALPLFIAGVLAAQQMHADQAMVDKLAMAFIAARLVYVALYLADVAALRTLVWGVGLACSVALFFQGA